MHSQPSAVHRLSIYLQAASAAVAPSAAEESPAEPEKLKEDLKLDYVAFSIPNDFILGYGLDYDQQGRQLKDVYTLCEVKSEE